MDNLADELRNFLTLLDKKEYFEAHEVLESVWHTMRRSGHPLQNLVKGLINGAVTFEHLKRNREGAADRARKVMASFERHKHLCTPEIEQAELFAQACARIEALKASRPDVFGS